ncbi:MAG: nucleotide sugar dehydrogenase [Cyanobacteria bacterium]|nr:nucleotide sugar dehydrogenase [Cyanobacteriota bacterium]
MTVLPSSPENLNPAKTGLLSVCVVGLGYVGMPTALLYARGGHPVLGVDINPTLVDAVNQRRIAAVYPELADWEQELLNHNQPLRAAVQPEAADVFIIAVPTPIDSQTKQCDLRAVLAATKSILPVLKSEDCVILESTVPPKTTTEIIKPLIESATGLSIGESLHLCFSPERVLPGNTTRELVENDRIIGGVTPQCTVKAKTLMQGVIQGQLLLTDAVTAEFCKLAENTYRDVNIALANELSVLADEYGVEITSARSIINHHPRVNLLQPGIGVGGHCIAVDPWFFVEASPINTRLIRTSREVNDRMPDYCAQRIIDAVSNIESPRICLLGLAYKPNIADFRESPALRIVDILKAKGYHVTTYDPFQENPEGEANIPLLELARDQDYLGILVSHTVLLEAYHRSASTLSSVMRTPLIRIF